MGYYERQQQWWFTLAAIALATVCLIIIMSVWHAVHMPPQNDIQKARDAFISGCTNLHTSGWSDSTVSGVSNTGSNNPHDWTCVVPK